ncbi:MAG: molybdenum cofactor guanylyltransferase MobA [Proteobacteria bacterium]|jgi:molybdopterin-guanine dinucleotide biosynthesis protein A|nr:molybdenum cofactor guanylyltransferase MobA [Pseudomonadota bacterium]MDA1238762.1 molybdenum cofactor guanylyltransferase MobA [Pseudomonadota bacterium]
MSNIKLLYPAIILAGGKASRLGGKDKGLLKLKNSRIIDLVIERLKPQVNEIVINANGQINRFKDLGLEVISDDLPDFPGPLAGVLAGLDWAFKKNYSHIITVAADTPFFPLNLVKCLAKAADGHRGLSLASTQDAEGKRQRHPTFGLWPTNLREDLRDELNNGLRKIVLWTDKHNPGYASFDSAKSEPFFNINTPEDLEIARTRWAHIQ